MNSKNYPIGVQNFEKLRKDGYLYIDKTALVYRLVKTGSYYFLSRPRRFGKSLLISTLEAYFQGKKELFEGLAIENQEKDWVKYPILHIDLNTEKYDTPESLENKLKNTLAEWEEIYGARPTEVSLSMRFEGIIGRAYRKTGQRVAILVDEYDKPMLQAIGNDSLQEAFRSTLKAFYGALKSKDGCIKFAMLTGVTKFGKVSVFNDLNNLKDISMDERYIDICGITEKEIHENLEDELHELARKQRMSYGEVCKKLKVCYDGYHFVEDSVSIYNPFSLLNTFDQMKFGNYWFKTGVPACLVHLLKRDHYDLYQMAHEETDVNVLNSIDSTLRNPIPVIYQSGYLTIKGYDREFGIYRLGFPNREVEENFVKYLLPFYTDVDEVGSPFLIRKFVSDLRSGDCDAFFLRLQDFFEGAPYDEIARDPELHYRNVLFIVFKLISFYVKMEYRRSKEGIDLILCTDKFIYIMEFKLDGTAEEALEQINEEHCLLSFKSDDRKLFRIGVNFNAKTRNIEKWIVE